MGLKNFLGCVNGGGRERLSARRPFATGLGLAALLALAGLVASGASGAGSARSPHQRAMPVPGGTADGRAGAGQGPPASSEAAGLTTTTSPAITTTTTVQAANAPSTSRGAPAPDAPSLAGAYATDMTRVVQTLLAYRDWALSQPGPLLVANYSAPGSQLYEQDVRTMARLKERSWRASLPAPVVGPVVLLTPPGTEPASTGGVVLYPGEDVGTRLVLAEVDLHQHGGNLVDSTGAVVGRASTGGPGPYLLGLGRSPRGQWLIATLQPLDGKGSPEEGK